ncbi:MAG: branched-chain amino acid ABC transporter substrate-binding protein [Dehalococcoidia bacterium]
MERLISLPDVALVVGALLVATLFSAAVNVAIHHIVEDDDRERSGATAAAYMTALGSLFAILTGFLINTEYSTLRDTQNLVGREVAAASRLAYSTEGLPAADVQLVQSELNDYLVALDRDEWRALSNRSADRSSAFDALKDLQQTVFAIGSRPYAPATSSEGMQQAVGDLSAHRAVRVAIASQTLPAALFALSVAAGAFLIVNAIVVALRSGLAYTLVAIGIIIIVPLDLAAILAVSGPFRGPFQTSREPIEQLQVELAEGRYLTWVEQQESFISQPDTDECGSEATDCIEIRLGEPIELGALLWLDPEECCVGIDALVGVRLAIDYLDGTFDGVDGTLMGRRVLLAADSEGCDPEEGRIAATRMAATPKLLGVIGTSCSGTALDIADRIFSERGILLVSPSNTAPTLTSSSRHERYYFRTAYNDKIQGAVIAEFAYQSLGRTAVAVDDGSAYSSELTRVFAQRFSFVGGAMRSRERLALDEPMEALVERVARQAPEVILLTLYEPTCHEVVRAMRRDSRLAATPIVVSDSCMELSFLSEAGDSASNVYGSGVDIGALQSSAFYSEAFLPAYARTYGSQPASQFHAAAFDATNLIFDAIRRVAEPQPSGALRIDRSALRAAMLAVQGYPGLSGPLSCRPTGDCAQGARLGIYAAPAWPIGAGGSLARPVFSQAKALAEVERFE